MGRKKKELLALPAQASKDVKSVMGIADRWAVSAENVIKETFDWAKKHKLLVVAVIGLIALKRYWLDTPSEKTEEEDF